MGICNITPDSFSDGGCFFDSKRALARVEALLEEGADIVDIGGESTRPGSSPVDAHEQLDRVLPVVEWAASRACVSIDTTSPEVAAACLDAGAHVVNDVSMLGAGRDGRLAGVVAKAEAVLVLSHARAPQEAMRGFGQWNIDDYGDVVVDVLADWERAAALAISLSVPREALVMDPGLGFSKASSHSLELLRRSKELTRAMGRVPVLVGASRKSCLTLVDAHAPPTERLGASLAAAVHAVRCGVHVVRVHDVRATCQALAMDRLLTGSA
jgi:dihydropteroate synthase